MKCDPPASIHSAIIPLATAKEMYEEYGSQRRVGLIEDYENSQAGQSGFQATRYADFEYEKLKAYVEYLKCIDEELDNSIPRSKIETVRLYFTNYPSSGTFANGDPVPSKTVGVTTHSYAGKNTIILAPTTTINGKAQCFLYKDSTPGIEVKAFNTTNTLGYQSPMMNEAGLTPPPPQSPPNNYFGY